jgi:hypothetical protein
VSCTGPLTYIQTIVFEVKKNCLLAYKVGPRSIKVILNIFIYQLIYIETH